QADEHVHRAVMVDGAKDVIEIDGPVEESPTYVAHQGTKISVDGDQMAPAGVVDMREVFIAFKSEIPRREGLVSQSLALGTGGFRPDCNCCAHNVMILPYYC